MLGFSYLVLYQRRIYWPWARLSKGFLFEPEPFSHRDRRAKGYRDKLKPNFAIFFES